MITQCTTPFTSLVRQELDELHGFSATTQETFYYFNSVMSTFLTSILKLILI